MTSDGTQLYNEFSRYGHCDITSTYSAVRFATAPLEVEIRIMLNPEELANDYTLDMKVRAAMYRLAEGAIAFARTKYRLIAAPVLDINGQIYRNGYLGQPELEEPTIITTGMLTLRIVDRDAN